MANEMLMAAAQRNNPYNTLLRFYLDQGYSIPDAIRISRAVLAQGGLYQPYWEELAAKRSPSESPPPAPSVPPRLSPVEEQVERFQQERARDIAMRRAAEATVPLNERRPGFQSRMGVAAAMQSLDPATRERAQQMYESQQGRVQQFTQNRNREAFLPGDTSLFGEYPRETVPTLNPPSRPTSVATTTAQAAPARPPQPTTISPSVSPSAPPPASFNEVISEPGYEGAAGRRLAGEVLSMEPVPGYASPVQQALRVTAAPAKAVAATPAVARSVMPANPPLPPRPEREPVGAPMQLPSAAPQGSSEGFLSWLFGSQPETLSSRELFKRASQTDSHADFFRAARAMHEGRAEGGAAMGEVTPFPSPAAPPKPSSGGRDAAITKALDIIHQLVLRGR